MKIKEIIKLVDDLFWDYDRLTSSGKETLDKLGDLLEIEERLPLEHPLVMANMKSIAGAAEVLGWNKK